MASGATPATPIPLIGAAIVPAVCVPCPARSCSAALFEQSPARDLLRRVGRRRVRVDEHARRGDIDVRHDVACWSGRCRCRYHRRVRPCPGSRRTNRPASRRWLACPTGTRPAVPVRRSSARCRARRTRLLRLLPCSCLAAPPERWPSGRAPRSSRRGSNAVQLWAPWHLSSVGGPELRAGCGAGGRGSAHRCLRSVRDMCRESRLGMRDLRRIGTRRECPYPDPTAPTASNPTGVIVVRARHHGPVTRSRPGPPPRADRAGSSSRSTRPR